MAASVALAMNVDECHAAGFGVIQLQSWLGEPLRLNVAVIGTESSPQWYSCIKARVESLDSTVLITPKINVLRTAQSPSIQLTTHQNINEPVMNVSLELGCEMSVRRSYQILLDPVAFSPGVDDAAMSGAEAEARRAIQVPQANIQVTPAALPIKKSSGTASGKPQNRVKKSRNGAAINAGTGSGGGAKPKTASSNVLRLTLLEEPAKDLAGGKKAPAAAPAEVSFGASPALKLAATLPPPAFNPGDLSSATQLALIKSLQVEIDTLRGDNDRLKLKAATDIQALQTVRSELFSWIKSLGVVVLMCLAAIAWLAWRFIAIRKGANQAAWNALSAETSYPPRQQAMRRDNQESAASIEHIFKPVKTIDPPAGSDAMPVAADEDADQKEDDLLRLHHLYKRHTEMSARAAEMAKMRQPEPALEPDLGAEKKELAASKAEEISDVMELVGAWMALHKPLEVLKLLEPFNHVDAPDSPLPWLCLLDVYNNLNDQEKYEAIGKRIVTLFNAKVAPWEQRLSIGQASLANFPHVVNKILALWDTDEIEPYLASLLVNDRDESRAGFDLAIYRDIERLHTLAKDPQRPRHIDQLRDVKAGAILFAAPPELDGTPAASGKAATPKRDSPYQYGGHYSGFSEDRYLNLNGTETTDFAKALDELVLDEPAILLPADQLEEVQRNETNTANEANTASAAALVDEPLVSGDEANQNLAASEGADDKPASLAVSPMNIKLNLAIAYQDIGDSEGAEILLQEVIKDGTPEQVEQAKSMLELMG